MAISLTDFQKDGSFYPYITKTGLIDKIGKEGVDQDELLAKLTNSVTFSGINFDVEGDDGEFSKENPDVFSDNEITLPSIEKGYAVIEDPAQIALIENKTETAISVSSTEVLTTLTDSSAVYKDIKVTGGEVKENTVYLSATNKVSVSGITIDGEKTESNGKIVLGAEEVEIKNVTVNPGSTVYNVFEGLQTTSDTYNGIKKFTAYNVTCNNPDLKHNVFNIYTPQDDAVINIKKCNFDLNVNNSNILRLSNYLNAKNVTVNFTDVNWTYENSPENSDFSWAGLVIYQPAGADTADDSGDTFDTSAITTWKFNFKNCKYNGEKVTSNNFGERNQAIYFYNINGSGAVSNPTDIEGVTVNFS